MASNGRPNLMFPALRSLYLQSTDSLSMMIAFSVRSYVQLVDVDLGLNRMGLPESKEPITALCAAPGEQPSSLSVLRVHQPSGVQCIRNISRLRSMRSLHVVLSAEEVSAIGPNFWTHREVIFEESPSEDQVNPDYVEACKQNIETIRATEGDPRRILVHGGSGFQSKLASAYGNSPSQSSSVHTVILELLRNGGPHEDILVPATIAIYLTRNRRLEGLTVKCVTGMHAPPDALERARTSVPFNDTQVLLTRLASASDLRDLTISGIAFKGGDIISQVLVTTQSLPKLAFFSFLPYQLSARPADRIVPPAPAVLADIPRYNPRLRTFATCIDLSAAAISSMDIPPQHTPGNRLVLEDLTLIPGMSLFFPAYSTQEHLKLAMYLYRLFPNLKKLSRMVVNEEVTAFWSPIELMIEYFRQVRRLPEEKGTSPASGSST